MKFTKRLLKFIEDLKKQNIDNTDQSGNNLLHCAVNSKDIEQVQAVTLHFINHNKSLSEINNDGLTPAQIAEKDQLLNIYYWLLNPVIELYKTEDHIGQFYKNLRIEGENTECICYLYNKENKKELVKLVYLHETFGGWRLLEYCFTKAGLDGGFSQVSLKNKWLKFFVLNSFNLIKAIFIKVLKKYQWKINLQLPNRRQVLIKICDFDQENTLNFLKKCKDKKELFYTTLIKICNDCLTKELLSKTTKTHWLLTMPDPYKGKEIPHHYNDFSFLPFSIHPKDSAQDIKRKIGLEYFLLSYLKVLWEIKLFNYLYSKFPQFIRSKMKNGETRFATFSFFGKKKYNQPVGLYGATNANCFCAVTIISIIENDQLCISLDIHPSYIKNEQTIDIVLNEIKRQVIQYE